MAKYQPEYLTRLERHIKVAVGLLPEEAPASIPIQVPVKVSKVSARLWPQRQARPFSSNGAQAFRR